MNCSRCNTINRAGRKFCSGCGARLVLICAACATPNEIGEAFCGECGAALQSTAKTPQTVERAPANYTPKHLTDRILQSRSALEGERKQVTVLFADVKGSMELAEQLDPEEWHSILERFFAILTEGVHRFEGTVNQYTGDGIMALFGAPIAHEDHAQRACYAALHLRESLRLYADELRRTRSLNFSTRIGIHSGEVVVGRIGDDLRMDYTAQGHTVGLAQRMEQLAAADSAYVSATTARLVEGYFVLRDLGEFALKGSTAPMHVFDLQGVGTLRTRLDSSRARGFSAFVGRTREMAGLDSALEAALSGNGQVIGVVAEAGTGKSRLCLEFVERCKARGIRVNAAHCPSHGKTVPYLPLLEMLRDIFGIQARDSDHEARRKIAGELTLLDATLQSLLPILFEFMGVPDPTHPAPAMSPDARQQQLFAFVRHLVQARSQREPTVLYLDDAHWIDPGSDAFLAQAVEAAAQSRTLWLVNFRPEYHADWMNRSFYQHLPLRPLGMEEIAALLADLLGNDRSVAALPARIRERTGGNPFFIEEIVMSLVENGALVGAKGNYRLVSAVDTLNIPATVQSVLAARLDRLAERDKRVLQTASVIGKEFPAELLERVIAADADPIAGGDDLRDALAALARAEFIYEAAVYPDVEYAFKHPLTQEVAYRSQLQSRRAQVHARIAQAIEQDRAEALDEHAALLGYHREQAGEVAIAARWYARAATVAGTNSPIDAARNWEKTWSLLQTAIPDDDVVALRLRAGTELLNFSWRLGMSDQRIAEIFATSNALAAARGDARAQVLLHYARASVESVGARDLQSAIRIYEAGVMVADANGDPDLRWSARTGLDFSHWLQGDLVLALGINDEQMALGEIDPALGLKTIGASTADTLWHRGMILTDLGRLTEGIEWLQRAGARARSFGSSEMENWIDAFSAHAHTRTGDAPEALAVARRAVESAEKIGSVLARVLAYGAFGMASVLARNWREARDSLALALQLSRVNQTAGVFSVYYLAGLAEAHVGLDDVPSARLVADQAVAMARQTGMRVAEIRAHLATARVLCALDGTGQTGAITTILDEAYALMQSTGARSYAPEILAERAMLAGLIGNAPARWALLRQAQDQFAEMGANGHSARITAMLAEAPQ